MSFGDCNIQCENLETFSVKNGNKPCIVLRELCDYCVSETRFSQWKKIISCSFSCVAF